MFGNKWRPFPDWHLETVVCSLQGHVLPARFIKALSSEDSSLGIELQSNRRLLHCTRCDCWIEKEVPQEERTEEGIELSTLRFPPRGKTLRSLILLRLIAVSKGLHAVAFSCLWIILAVLHFKLGGLHQAAQGLYNTLQQAQAADTPGRDMLNSALRGMIGLKQHTVHTLMIAAAVYALIESIECWGLWNEKRWAEYLTVVATSGLVPVEIHEILLKQSPLRIGALVVNLAIVGWLVWNKRLFGVRGGHQAQLSDQEESVVVLDPLIFKA